MQPLAEMGEVTAIRSVSSGTWEITVKAPRIVANSTAGQFVHVRTNTGFNPFLRRPLSIGPGAGDTLRLLFTVRGEGTRLLTEKKPGDPIDLIGPLGHGFTVNPENAIRLLIAGGIGIVPLLFLHEDLGQNPNHKFFLGVRSLDALPVSAEEITQRGILVSSEDGSIGTKGLVTDLVRTELENVNSKQVEVFACGPVPMLKAIKELCQQYHLPAQISLEVSMGCGIGACQSCAVPKPKEDGYLLVCKDGPVFDLNEVDLTAGGAI